MVDAYALRSERIPWGLRAAVGHHESTAPRENRSWVRECRGGLAQRRRQSMRCGCPLLLLPLIACDGTMRCGRLVRN